MSAEFDRYADRYEELVERSISFSGLEHAVFLETKAAQLLDVAGRRLADPSGLHALDVGCGAGLMHGYLTDLGHLEGVDVSAPVVDFAREANPHVDYHVTDGSRLPFDDETFDLTFSVCVLHHVPLAERPAFVSELGRVTRRGGLSVVFEHNPLNPLTRLAVSRCEFDEDAVLLRRGETRRRLQAAGQTPVEERYILFFPWRAALLERAERALAPLPFGAQYYVAART